MRSVAAHKPMKNILLVGGPGSAIGARLLERFREDRHRVVATYHSARPPDETGVQNGAIVLRSLDVTDVDQVRALVDSIERDVGPIDVLINNAGCSSNRLLPLMPPREWERVLAVNLTGVFNTCQAVARRMVPRKDGKIINVASAKGLSGAAGESAYAASKAGVIALSKSLARELAPGGVQVHTVCPGYIPSRLSGTGHERRETEAQQALLDTRHNLDDLAEFIGFLCTGQLRSVTGQVFHIDSRIH